MQPVASALTKGHTLHHLLPIPPLYMADITISCRDCNNDFQFTEGEQEHFAKLNFSNPIRCKDCRNAKKSRHEAPRSMRENDEEMA